MANPPYIFDATAENFQRLVLGNSDKGPVLVNYWSPRAGPCMMLMPRLIRLTSEFEGRFLLVMFNTDELNGLVRKHGVNSLPTVKVFRHGKIIDTLYGAESETVLRQFVRKHVNTQSDSLHLKAIGMHQHGDTDKAISLAVQAVLRDPDNVAIPIDLARLMILQKRYAQAANLIDTLPVEAHGHEEIRILRAHLGFISTAKAAPPAEDLEEIISQHPDNLKARYQLSAVMVINDNYTVALDQLLEVVKQDCSFQDHLAQDGMLAIFRLLGDDDERVPRYRSSLLDAMH